MINAGASPGETKLWAAVRETAIFALAVRITGKLLKIDGYMLQDNLQASNSLSIHTTFSVIAPGPPQGKQKCGKNSDFWTYALT